MTTHAAHSPYCFTYHVQVCVLTSWTVSHMIENVTTCRVTLKTDLCERLSMQDWDKKNIYIVCKKKNWAAYEPLGTGAVKYF